MRGFQGGVGPGSLSTERTLARSASRTSDVLRSSFLATVSSLRHALQVSRSKDPSRTAQPGLGPMLERCMPVRLGFSSTEPRDACCLQPRSSRWNDNRGQDCLYDTALIWYSMRHNPFQYMQPSARAAHRAVAQWRRTHPPRTVSPIAHSHTLIACSYTLQLSTLTALGILLPPLRISHSQSLALLLPPPSLPPRAPPHILPDNDPQCRHTQHVLHLLDTESLMHAPPPRLIAAPERHGTQAAGDR